MDEAGTESRTLVAEFESDDAARRAVHRLRSMRFDVNEPGHARSTSTLVAAHCRSAEALRTVAEVLRSEGGVILEEPHRGPVPASAPGALADPAHAPRPVQDGFTDVEPGIVPRFAPDSR